MERSERIEMREPEISKESQFAVSGALDYLSPFIERTNQYRSLLERLDRLSKEDKKENV